MEQFQETKKTNNITHNNWNFDSCGNKAIYSYGAKSLKHFKKYEGDIPTNIANTNELSIESYRKAGLIHKLIRTKLRQKVKPGVSFLDLANDASTLVNMYVKPTDNGGFAFPLGISVNEICAHDSAMVTDNRVLKQNDIVKIDLGIHINGYIVDSAWTMIVDGSDEFVNIYQPLLDATIDSTYTGISMAGPDAIITEISSEIQEVIESYELGDGRPISSIWGLGGHNILPYKVHGGKLILCIPHVSQSGQRMVEDEIYAIETFASTGNGKLTQGQLCNCNHFMMNDSENFQNKIETSKNPVVSWAAKKNNNLPFTQLWCTEIKNSRENLDKGIREKIIVPYPPLTDNTGTFTSQLEHTIHIKSNAVEILTLGIDY